MKRQTDPHPQLPGSPAGIWRSQTVWERTQVPRSPEASCRRLTAGRNRCGCLMNSLAVQGWNWEETHSDLFLFQKHPCFHSELNTFSVHQAIDKSCSNGSQCNLKLLNTFVQNLPVKRLNTAKLRTVLNSLLKLEIIFITFLITISQLCESRSDLQIVALLMGSKSYFWHE